MPDAALALKSDPENLVWVPNSPGAAEFLYAADDEVIAHSPLGQGKSTLHCLKALVWCEEYEGSYNVLLRKFQVDATTHLARTFKRVVGDDAFLAGWNEQKARWRDPDTHSEIGFGGIDNPSKWAGGEIGYAGVDEIVPTLGAALSTGVDEDEWLGIAKRLRDPNSKVHQLAGTTNPGWPSHWVLRRASEGLVRLIKLDPTANEENLPSDYRERKKRLTGVQYARYVLGQWVAAEGLVYCPPFDRNVHIRDGIAPAEGYPIQVWIDWGFSHAFCALFAWKGSDDVWHVFDEIHGRGRTVQEWATKAKAHLAANYPTNRVRKTITDVDEDKQRTWARYCPTGDLITADKDIESGVDAVIDALRVDDAGKTHLLIAPRCVQLISQVESLPWDPRKDRPAKQEGVQDDAVDPLRYGIKTNRYGAKDGSKRAIESVRRLRYAGGFSAIGGRS